MTAVTSGSADWGCLSWASLPSRVLLLVGLGLVGPRSVSWEWTLSSKPDGMSWSTVFAHCLSLPPQSKYCLQGGVTQRGLGSLPQWSRPFSGHHPRNHWIHSTLKAGSAPPWMTNRSLQQTLADPSSRNKKMVQLPGYGIGSRAPRVLSREAMCKKASAESLGSSTLICY